MPIVGRQQVLLWCCSVVHLTGKILRFGSAPRTGTQISVTVRIMSLPRHLPMGHLPSPMAFQLVHMSIAMGHPSVGVKVMSLLPC